MIRLFSHVILLMPATVMSTVSTPSGTTVSRRKVEHYVALSNVGYFHTNKRFDDVELCGDHFSRYFPSSPILMVKFCILCTQLEALSNGKNRRHVMQLSVKDDSNNWKMVGADVGNKLFSKEPSANVILLHYISSES
ncbi:LOW QUALITY PROTEIN: hypothetical protein HID58_086138 [Brassica napus]|uniref:Uncharacterized protein n=1 Tax=Brassica napus TaxID=3708 RepID=A0ABQ7XRG6_BRANA|nr:LOW QUALITY PROTEIN: hypothetical protein HID58_086138 [Brassica napus]